MLTSEAERVLKDYERACREDGLFTAPFLVMAVWRRADGSRIPAGMPVLLTPNSVAPSVAVSGDGVSESATALTVRIMGRACSLYMRIPEIDLMHHVRTSLRDVSPATETMIPETAPGNIGDLGITHLEILATREVTLRGPYVLAEQRLRTVEPAGYSRSFTRDADGILSGGDEQAASSGERIRAFSFGALSPEAVDEAVTNLSGFRMIGSIPADELTESTEFFKVKLLPGALSATLSNAPADEAENVAIDFGALTQLVPEHVSAVSGRLVALGGKEVPPAPCSLREAGGFCGEDAGLLSGDWQTATEVELVKDGVVICRRTEPVGAAGWTASPDEGFPRWFFYPDRDARSLTVEYWRGEEREIRRLPLTPHPWLDGAYWYEGGKVVKEVREVSEVKERYRLVPARVAVGSEGLPFAFPTAGRFTCGHGAAVAAVPAVRSLSSGQLGEFPMLVFADEGIWAVGRVSDGGFKAVQPVSLHRCSGVKTVVPTPDGTFFLTASGPFLVDGTRVKRLSEDWETARIGPASEACAWYDAGRDTLHLFRPGGEGRMVWDFAEGKWYFVAGDAPLYVAGEGRDALLIGADGEIYGAESETEPRKNSSGWWPTLGDGVTVQPGVIPLPDLVAGRPGGNVVLEERWWVVTLRPLKLGKATEKKRLREIEVPGDAGPVWIRIWGEDRCGSGSSRWRLLGEGVDRISGLVGSGHRRFRVQLLFRAAEKSPGPLLFRVRPV